MMRPLVIGVLAVLLAGCGVLNIEEPVFSDRDSELQMFPLFPDNNGKDPLRPGDKVRTMDDAIKIALTSCGNAADDPAHWDAFRDGEVWRVTWKNGRDRIDVLVDKKDGNIAACEIDMASGK